jgi:hypothetical protein
MRWRWSATWFEAGFAIVPRWMESDSRGFLILLFQADGAKLLRLAEVF